MYSELLLYLYVWPIQQIYVNELSLPFRVGCPARTP
jgi:hypothetical protein